MIGVTNDPPVEYRREWHATSVRYYVVDWQNVCIVAVFADPHDANEYAKTLTERKRYK